MDAMNEGSVGMIGAGRVAQALAREAVSVRRKVILSNSRGPESLTRLVGALGPGAVAGTVHDATEADIVVLAVGWDQVKDAVRGETDWQGKVVVDTTNQWHNHDPRQPADIGDLTGSEYIAELLPGARVVKAFNTVYSNSITRSIATDAGPLVIFLAGDDGDAKAAVSSFIAAIRLAPIDLAGCAKAAG